LPALATTTAKPLVNDVSGLNPIEVDQQHRPRTTEQVRDIISSTQGLISIGGGRFSMGGQIAEENSVHLDMRAMNRTVWFDPLRKVIRVQAGMDWRSVQDVVDPHDLSVKIMQSYSNFTAGGSVSVNCHGRYVGRGPIVNSVRALELVTARGEVLELSRSQNPELFRAVHGGYGAVGVITEVELDLADNVRIERVVSDVALDEYSGFFAQTVARNPAVVLHNADLAPPDFKRPRAISWIQTDRPAAPKSRLVPRGVDYTREKNAIWAVSELPGAHRLRERLADRQRSDVVWLNYEASLDAASLEPRTRAISTYLLQEYFIPTQQFHAFAQAMTRILKRRKVTALNISIRHSPPDRESLLTWAPTEVFSFVLYYKQRTDERASLETRRWTRELIDAALAQGGRYYLPYRLDATLEQFERAYPESALLRDLKRAVDPRGRLSNRLLSKYLGS
jgi:FAD/FMN-containing dehydrogenase